MSALHGRLRPGRGRANGWRAVGVPALGIGNGEDHPAFGIGKVDEHNLNQIVEAASDLDGNLAGRVAIIDGVVDKQCDALGGGCRARRLWRGPAAGVGRLGPFLGRATAVRPFTLPPR